MNIVVVTGPYGPVMSPESNCVERYISHLKETKNVFVISPLSDTSNDICDENDVHYRFISNPTNSLRVYFSKRQDRSFFYKFGLFIIRLYGFVISPFLFPTGNAWRKKQYYNEIRKIEKECNIDAIISVAGFPCAHLSVIQYKKNHPDVVWITYTLDPFTINTDIYNYVLFKKKRYNQNYMVEQEVYQYADYNIFTQELFGREKDIFNLPSSKTICFPYTLTNIKKDNSYNYYCDKTKPARILYAGALYKDIRNPERMLSVISQLENTILDLYVAGNCSGIIKKYESDRIRVHSILNKEEYVRTIIEDADFLVNIGNTIKYMAPSKLLELISTGKPVINFYHHIDVYYEMIEKYPLGINIGNSLSDVIRLKSFIDQFKGSSVDFESLLSIFPDNCIQNQLLMLERMFTKSY